MLSTPVTKKIETEATHEHEGLSITIASSEMQGWRQYMEDTTASDFSQLAALGVALISVFDGHGGKDTSAQLRDHFNPLLMEKIKAGERPCTELLQATFMEFDAKLGKTTKHNGQGSTGTVCVIDVQANKVLIAHCGDSRAIAFGRKSKEALLHTTLDHHPTDPVELARLRKYGMYVDVSDDRVVKGSVALNLSRSFGDWNFKNRRASSQAEQGFLVFPEVWETSLSEAPLHGKGAQRRRELCLVLASDGLWGGMMQPSKTENVDQQVAGWFRAVLDSNPLVAGKAVSSSKKGGKLELSKCVSKAIDMVTAGPGKWQNKSTDNISAVLLHLTMPISSNTPAASSSKKRRRPSDAGEDGGDGGDSEDGPKKKKPSKKEEKVPAVSAKKKKGPKKKKKGQKKNKRK